MRARRLRRLGQLTGAAVAACVPAVTEPAEQRPAKDVDNTTTGRSVAISTSTVSGSQIDSQKNKLMVGSTPVSHDDDRFSEMDDIHHKQKHQKFSSDHEHEMMFAEKANNNVEIVEPARPSLPGCSRLLREFEFNLMSAQTSSAATTAATNQETKMDIEESGDEQSATAETMDTEEATSTAPLYTPLAHKSASEILLESEICVSRILNAFWAEHCEGQVIVSDTALQHKETPDDVDDLVSNVLMEICMQYFDGILIDLRCNTAEPCKEGKPTAKKEAAALTTAAAAATDSGPSCLTPTMLPFNLANHAIVKFLIASHDRCNKEFSTYSETRKRKDYGDAILGLINRTKVQLIEYSVLILNGTITLPTLHSAAPPQDAVQRSPLLDLLYDHHIPSDYLQSLITEAHKSPATLATVFGNVVDNLFVDMQSRIVSAQLNIGPIAVLNELFHVTLTHEPNTRPICNMVGKLYNFYPTLVTEMTGREITYTSYLGPFLSVSVFIEENPMLFEDELSRRVVERCSADVQQQLENMRSLLHSVFHNLLKNVESRNSVLMYFSAILKHNDKRTQFQFDEKTLARDGFMLNVLSVLQKLSVKIKLERVDSMYPFHWESMIAIGKDTKLRFDEPAYEKFVGALRKLEYICNSSRFNMVCFLFAYGTYRRIGSMGDHKLPDALLVPDAAGAPHCHHAGHSAIQQAHARHQRVESHAVRSAQDAAPMGEHTSGRPQ